MDAKMVWGRIEGCAQECQSVYGKTMAGQKSMPDIQVFHVLVILGNSKHNRKGMLRW
tara:strand:- start:2272 stop:2442 length:171 start_codon:yes stop_codon:yes gene_type:complete